MSNHRTNIDELTVTFKALANPNRLALFESLMDQCCPDGTSCCEDEVSSNVTELAGCCDIAPSTLSHHLKELRQAGLVRTEKRGKFVHCWVDPEMLEPLSDFFKPRPHSKKE